jgi:hypothetical protein
VLKKTLVSCEVEGVVQVINVYDEKMNCGLLSRAMQLIAAENAL